MIDYSFIIPVFNCEEYIEACVKSVIEIGLESYEIILVDDGSTDNSGILCDALDAVYGRVKCIHQENQGVSAARNHGLQAAVGDYVIFIDADDTIEPVGFEKILKRLQEDSEIDVVIFGISFDYYYHGKCYRRDELPPALNGRIARNTWMDELRQLYETNALSPIWNKVIRRSFLKDNHLELRRDMFLYEDLEFSLRCLAHCGTILFLPDIIYHYRQTEDEGNAGRRLKRIDHLPSLVGQIEEALNNLTVCQNIQEMQEGIKEIPLLLYLVLAREKIAVSTVREIKVICRDFSTWWSVHAQPLREQDKQFVDQLLHQKIAQMMCKRTYVAARHKIAVSVKSSALYRKLR